MVGCLPMMHVRLRYGVHDPSIHRLTLTKITSRPLCISNIFQDCATSHTTTQVPNHRWTGVTIGFRGVIEPRFCRKPFCPKKKKSVLFPDSEALDYFQGRQTPHFTWILWDPERWRLPIVILASIENAQTNWSGANQGSWWMTLTHPDTPNGTGIFTYIYHKFKPCHVGKYFIHGAYWANQFTINIQVKFFKIMRKVPGAVFDPSTDGSHRLLFKSSSDPDPCITAPWRVCFFPLLKRSAASRDENETCQLSWVTGHCTTPWALGLYHPGSQNKQRVFSNKLMFSLVMSNHFLYI